jgi:Mg2+ and Co2+ transporter CorA
MNPALFQMPFVQVTLPVLAGMFLAVRSNSKSLEKLNKRFDDLDHYLRDRFEDINRHFDEIDRRFDHFNKCLDRILGH